jgi:hypothetical protein
MPSWPVKDPEAVLDYTYTIPLDQGDTVASSTFTKLSGDVAVDNSSRVGNIWTAYLSGGTDGETAVFRVFWTTTAGRTSDDIITLPVVENGDADLVFEGYVKPTAANLIARYPAFALIAIGTIRLFLRDAERSIDTSWSEADYAPALMALAAHRMSGEGLGATASSTSVPAGVTRMKSGSLELGFSEKVAQGQVTAALDSTRYGAEYLALLRRNKAGPRVMGTGYGAGNGWDIRMGRCLPNGEFL